MPYIGRDIESITFNSANNLNVVGNITLSGTVDGRDVATDGTKLDTVATSAIANLSEDTTPQLGGNLDLNTNNVIGTGNINVTGSITGTSFVSTGDMSFTNNSKAKFGTSPSLEIYHDGSNSILDDVGAGNFKMQLGGADKLEVTSTGVDVTGTVTADGLTVDTTTLVVDSTNNRVGIGTSAPDAASHIVGTNGKTTLASHDAQTIAVVENNSDAQFAIVANSANSSQLFFGDESSELVGRIRYDHSADAMRFYTNSSERMRIDSSGKVGIGTSAPATAGVGLHVQTSSTSISDTVTADVQAIFERNGNAGIAIVSGASSIGSLKFGAPGDLDGGRIVYSQSEDSMRFLTADSERMRIDSSGNVLVGATSNNSANVGHGFQADGFVYHTRDGGAMLRLNRLTSDGEIQQFQKDGTTVGSIGVNSGDNLYFSTANTGFKIADDELAIIPANSDGSNSDNDTDLGMSAVRFKDLYLSGGAYIGGTGSANKLDDYEEGEFDVDVSTSNLTVNTSQDRCRYTKIGRMVYVTGTIKFSSVTSSSDTVTITGLPFSSAANVSGGEAYGHFTILLNNIDGGNAGNIALGGFGTTAATIYKQPESGSFDTLRTSDFNTSGNEIYFSGWYTAA